MDRPGNIVITYMINRFFPLGGITTEARRHGVAKQIHNLKGRHDKKAFRRLHNALLSLFDMHLSKAHIRFKVPSGEYGLSFVAF